MTPQELIETASLLFGGSSSQLDDLWDPQTGSWWVPLGGGGARAGGSDEGSSYLFQSEGGLSTVRGMMRQLALENVIAINVLENRVSYVVGEGMQFQVVASPDLDSEDFDSEQLKPVKRWLGSWYEENDIPLMQQEAQERADRDGEFILRTFLQSDGTVALRFVEPEAVKTPEREAKNPNVRFGILFDSVDKSRAVGYFIDGDLVDAERIIHFKLNVDQNVPRGVSTLWAIRRNCYRADRLLRNMSKVAQYQSAIAAVRQHEASAAAVTRFADRTANFEVTSQATGETTRGYKPPGEAHIVDIPKGQTVTFPSSAIAADKFVEILKAELRMAAARLVFPEFMLTSDASNGNYASIVVAEGPTYKKFKRDQAKFGRVWVNIAWQALEWAVENGATDTIDAALLEQVDIRCKGPELLSRTPLEVAQANEIKNRVGILSPQTWSQQDGLDYEEEQRWLDEHSVRVGAIALPTNPPAPGAPNPDPNAPAPAPKPNAPPQPPA